VIEVRDPARYFTGEFGCRVTGIDVTAEARRWFESVVTRMKKEGPPVLGLHLLLGPEMSVMSSNMSKNIKEERLRLVRAILKSPQIPSAS
jgi:hypothetical protein